MSRGTLLSAAVLAALAGSAYAAQPDDSVDHFPHKNPSAPNGGSFLPHTELNAYVFAVTAPNEQPGSRGNNGSAVAVGVGQFPAFPPAQLVPNPLPVNGFDCGWVAFGPAVPGAFDIQLLFFQDTIALNAAVPGSTPFYQNLVGGSGYDDPNFLGGFQPAGGVRIYGLSPSFQFVEWFGEALQISTPLLFDTTKTFAYEVRIFQSANPTVMWPGNAASASVIVPLIRGPVAPSVGTTDTRVWRDDLNAGGAYSLDGTRPVDFTASFPANPATTTSRRNPYVKLQANVNVLPPVFTDLGRDTTSATPLPPAYDCQAPHATFNRTVNLTAGGQQWFRMVLDQAINRDDGTWLDVVMSDGPDNLGVAGSCGFYNSDGQRLAFDTIEGNLNINTEAGATISYGEMTFGRGRRPSPQGGYALDGRDGEMPAGTYYICVSGAGALYGDSLFLVNSNDSLDVGDVTLSVSANTGAPNCPNADPIQPQVRTNEEVGDLTNGLTTRDLVRTGRKIVRWVRFNLTADQEVTPTGSTFLDINQNGTPVTDPSMGLYDNSGALVAFDRDSGPSTSATQRLGQISIGGSASGSRPADGDGVPYTNYSGSSLSPGTYWLAVGMDSDTESTTGEPMRFDSTGWLSYQKSDSFITVTVNFKTPTGCRIDYNNDGSVNPDDIGDFITDYYTDPPVAGPGGYAIPCPDNTAPYDQGYKAAYNSSGAGQCNPPFSDNLGDFITDYFTDGLCSPPA